MTVRTCERCGAPLPGSSFTGTVCPYCKAQSVAEAPSLGALGSIVVVGEAKTKEQRDEYWRQQRLERERESQKERKLWLLFGAAVGIVSIGAAVFALTR